MTQDLLKLQSAILSSNTDAEQAVTVNQRHLIDKILARYASDYTYLRELLQNSNDALADKVEILFETMEPSTQETITSTYDDNLQRGGAFSFSSWFKNALDIAAPTEKPKPIPARQVKSITYRNNGQPFSPQDWHRLSKIAEGNPDESKIGMFGVGFYSLFSLCEQPLITSGDTALAFFWKGDQLFTKKSKLESLDEWTTFFMSLREPDALPSIPSLSRFITTSLGFTKNLKHAIVKVDGKVVIDVKKNVSSPSPLNVVLFDKPTGLFNLGQTSNYNLKNNFFQVNSAPLVQKISLQVATDTSHIVYYRLISMSLKTICSKSIAEDLERVTKKPPPKECTIHLLYANSDELKGSPSNLFKDLLPYPDQGHVIIGFLTQQTTGCAALISAPLIPTVERESIDFVDRVLSAWNKSLLEMAGVLARMAYNDDMSEVQKLFTATQDLLHPSNRASHATNSFSFLQPSTPSSLPGQIIAQSFYNCDLVNRSIQILSTQGVMAATQVRLSKEDTESFLKSTPVIPKSLLTDSKPIVDALVSAGAIKPVGLLDIETEVSQRIFTVEEATAMAKYWSNLDQNVRKEWGARIWNRLRVQVGENVVSWSNWKHFINPSRVPPDQVFPTSVAPFSITRHLNNSVLATMGLTELPFSSWLNFLCSPPHLQQLESDPVFAEKILTICSKGLPGLNSEQRALVVSALQEQKCVPTKKGMQLPRDSYFPKVNLFEDLPVLAFPTVLAKQASSQTSLLPGGFFGSSTAHGIPTGMTEQFLSDLGVRQTVELGLILSRVGSLGWQHEDLIRYLSSVKDKLSNVELEKLSNTPLFPSEASGLDGRFKPKELFFPMEKLRDLGLPLLRWNPEYKHKLRPNSEEWKLLSSLGVKQSLSLDQWLNALSKAEPTQRDKLLNYFIDNRSVYEKLYSGDRVTLKYLPCVVDGKEVLCTPSECFSDPNSGRLRFPVLKEPWRNHAKIFGVRDTPSSRLLIDALLSHPPTIKDAEHQFAWLASRMSDFTEQDWSRLKSSKWIPVEHTTGKFEWLEPTSVYFGSGPGAIFPDLPFVNFGAAGNSFLRASGVKQEPTPKDLAKRVVKNPHDYLVKVGVEKYLMFLRQLATMTPFDKSLEAQMRNSPWLLAIQAENTDQDEEKSTYTLAKPNDIVLVDDSILQNIFQPLYCPLETMLEGLYQQLGSQWLSSLVTEAWLIKGGQPQKTSKSEEMQNLIRDRAPLLLYEATNSMRELAEGEQKALETLKNLKVLEVPSIEIERKFKGQVKTQGCSASLGKDKNGNWFLLIARGEIDYFDVAQALGKLLFKRPRLNDSLLLSTLLSSTLLNLKRKGFPVDRILNNKMKGEVVLAPPPPVEKNVEPPPRQDSLVRKEAMDSRMPMDPRLQQLQSMFPDVDPAWMMDQLKKLGNSKDLQRMVEQMMDNGYPQKSTEVEKAESAVQKSPTPEPTREEGIMDKLGSWWGKESMPGAFPGGKVERPNQISPHYKDNLKSSLEQSIQSLRPATEAQFQATIPDDVPSPPMAVSAQERRGFCGVIQDSNLQFLGRANGLGLYVDKNVNQDRFQGMIQSGVVERFANLLNRLSNVFGISSGGMSSLARGMGGSGSIVNIWYDEEGPTIAFNRNKTLFFNLRYFATLHDGHSATEGIIYWFLTFAHEAAHNFVASHDAEHEFYFSSFAETYMPKLLTLIK